MEKRGLKKKTKRHSSNQSRLKEMGLRVTEEIKPTAVSDSNEETIFTDYNFTIVAKDIQQIDISDSSSNNSDDVVLNMLKEDKTNTDCNPKSCSQITNKMQVLKENEHSNRKDTKKGAHFWESEELVHDIKTTLETNTFQENEDFESITEKLANKATAVNRDTKIEQFHDEILTISKILQEYIKKGITAVYTPQTNTNDVIKIKIAANCCLTMLHLLWASNIFNCLSSSYIDKSMLQNVVDFIKNQIRTTIIPEYQNCSNKLIKQHENIKVHLNRATLAIYQKICEIIMSLSKLMEGPIILNDYYTTSLLFAVFAVFQTEHMIELQTVSLQIVVKICSNTSEESEISQLITRELLSYNAPQISEDYYTLNQYKPHLYTVLVLQIIQSKCHVCERNVSGRHIKDILNEAISKQLSTTKFCSEFIKRFLEKSVANNEGFRTLLKILFRDLIALSDKPEWPAAAYVIQELSNILNDENTEIEIRTVCIDFVAQVVVKLKSILTTLQGEERLRTILQPVIENRNEKMVFRLQQHILDFLEYDSNCDDVYHYALFFNMTLWLKNDFLQWICDLRSAKGKQSHRKMSVKALKNKKPTQSITPTRLMRMNKIMKRLTDFNTRKNKSNYEDNNNNKNLIDYKTAILISQCIYFGFDLLNCCDRYISVLRKVINDGNSVSEISKALKGATIITEKFPNTFSPLEINEIVNRYAFDTSATIKESAINLLGKYLMGSPKLTDNYYYELLCEKLRSEDVNVRKRSVDILRKIHSKISNENNLYLVLTKFHEDAKISKGIDDIFEEKWFTLSQDPLESVVEVVKQANNLQLKQIRSIFIQLYNRKQDGSVETKKIRMINEAMDKTLDLLKSSRSDLCLPYLVVLHMIAKANCKLIAKFAEDIHNMIDFNLRSTDAVKLIQKYVIKIIKLIIPVIGEQTDLINEVEMKLLRALGFLDGPVIKSCVICLAKLLKYTQNYSVIARGFCINYKLIRNIDKTIENAEEIKIKRSLILVGLLIQVFDFEDSNFIGSTAVIHQKIVEEVFQLLIRTLKKNDNNSIKSNVLECLGLICVKYEDFLLNADFQNICFQILKNEDGLSKLQILKMFKYYLHRQLEMETHSMQEKKFVDIKEIVDDTLGKPSTIIQTFLKCILRCVISTDSLIRQVTIEIIQQIHRQGYVNPVEIIPFLICMTFDPNEMMSNLAQSHLSELQLKYPHLINSQSLSGITLSFELLNKLGGASCVTRGLLIPENGHSVRAVNDFLYKLLQHSKRQWRGLTLRVLKQFDENKKHNLEYLIFLADNLSAFSYKTLDEVYFTIYYINELSIQYGANTLRTIRNKLNDKLQQKKAIEKNLFKNKKLILELFSNTVIDTKNYIYKFHVYSLLFQLKNYLMKKYGVKDVDVRGYLPSILLRTNENAICEINYKPFKPEDVLNACLEEKNNSTNQAGVKKEQVQQLKEDFFKKFCAFQKCVKTDEGDEEEDEN
ncbi:nipped-B-like protein [Agrilus planipennis]|uniref:Nipped-B protein n=1 Tax=Agrilus planipennis TaxID=224129 RepID=A0A1W4X8F1_AGRPL|nr:nipped-B-like protein [Agrilus planipennis]XP_018328683.1 nipped-B-like protein [Agrilus planipennis]